MEKLSTRVSLLFLFAGPALRGALIAWLAITLFGTTVLAQSTTGVIVGEVLDARTGAPLVGAEVRASRELATATGQDGAFFLRGAAPGVYELTVSYLGFQPGRASVTVVTGQRVERNFQLSWDSEVVALAAFQVTAELDAETRSKNRERNAVSLTNIVSSDALGNLPDTQVADALRRVPGISTIRTRGEGDTIVIRGADPSLNSINLDGVAIQSNADNGLSVSLNTFLIDQLASITVVKALTPDLPADSIGGYVDLQTKSPLDYKQPVFGVNANAAYNTTRREFSPRAGLTYLTQFGRNKQFGLSATASFQRRSAEAWRVESGSWVLIAGPVVTPTATFSNVYIPSTVETRTNRNDRDRYGLSLGFDWKVSAATRLYAKTNFDLQEEYEPGERQRLTLAATAAANFDLSKPFLVRGADVIEATSRGRTTATAERSITSKFQDTTSVIMKFGGRTDADRLHLDYSLGYSRTHTDVDQVFATFVRSNVDYRYTQVNAVRPHFDPVTSIDVNDPGIYPLNGLNLTYNQKDYDLVEVRLNSAYTLSLAGHPVTIKVGASGSHSKKVRDDGPFNSVSGTPLRSGPLLLNDPQIKLRRLPNNFLEGYDLGVGPEGESTHELARKFFDSGQLILAAGSGLIQNDYTIEQDITAAYASGEFKAGPAATVVGARFERTADDGTAFAIGSGTGATTTRITNHRSYDFVAPNFNTRIRFGEKWQARLAYTWTMRRPGYDSAAPRTTYSVSSAGAVTVNTFNPDLKQEMSRNFDVSLEYYFSRANRVTLGAFLKQRSDTLFSRVSTLPFAETPVEVQALLQNVPGTQLVTLTEQANGGDGEIRGIEAEYLHRLSFLPGLLRGLAFNANFTYIDSEWTRLQNNLPRTTRFPQQSRTTGNLALDYTLGKWFARTSYNWRASFLSSVNTTPDLNQYGGNAESIDLKVTYQFRPSWSFQFQAQNIKNDADVVWIGSALTRLRQYERSGADYSFGVNWKR